MTPALKSALLWLRNRNGEGVFGRTGVLLASGEWAGVTRTTWNRLIEAGLCEMHQPKRIRITDAGRAIDLRKVSEARSVGSLGR